MIGIFKYEYQKREIKLHFKIAFDRDKEVIYMAD